MKSKALPGALLGAAVVALVAVLVLIFLPRSADGTASAPASVLAYKSLTEVATAFADQPGAKYTGSVTAGEMKINLTDVEVSASGDLQGRIKVGGESAEIIGVNGLTYAKGSASFWKSQLEKPKMNYEAVASGWAKLDPATFPNLGWLLAPPNLAFALSNDEEAVDLESKGQPVGLIDTPDGRFLPAGLPDVIVEGDNTFVSGGTMRATTGPNKNLTTVKGPITQTGGERVEVDVSVEPIGPNEIGRLYDRIDAQAQTLAHIPAPYLSPNFDASGFRLTVSPCSPPICEYIVTYVARTPNATQPGSITVVGDMTLTLNDRPVGGTCTRTVTVPLNGQGETRCPFTVPNEDGTLKGDVAYVFTAYVDQDPTVLTRALAANEQISTAEAQGIWTPTGFKGDLAARDYNLQVTGAPSTYTYVVNDEAFDGRAPDGTLLMTFGPGYSANIGSNGALDTGWAGTDALVDTARAQIKAARSTPVRWVFAEQDAADATAKTLEDNGVRGIDIVVVPPAE
ncbi:hypothetical protein [Williamsia sp. 1135]|uniref:hypothetical protein n=1 Tax=Williamsia sp. 1135 TaxID=1889262 RepID=UPI00117ED7BC|nr:hypothetical protein [Williamsia sp. 1135]